MFVFFLSLIFTPKQKKKKKLKDSLSMGLRPSQFVCLSFEFKNSSTNASLFKPRGRAFLSA